MKKFLKITLVFAILVLCNISVVNATTNEELIAYISKNFTIAGNSVSLSSENKVKVQRYLNSYPVTSEEADKIIAKVDEGVSLMNAAGVSDPSKLSQTKKEELLSIVKSAAEIAGATITYDGTTGAIVVYRDGVKFDEISVKSSSSLVQTGSDYSYVVYAIAGVAVVAVAAVVIARKKKTVNV